MSAPPAKTGVPAGMPVAADACAVTAPTRVPASQSVGRIAHGNVERIQDLGRPLAPGDVVEHRLARVRMLGDPLAGEQVRDPVVQHEQRRDARRVVVLAEPDPAGDREDVRRRVPGDGVQPLRAAGLDDLHPLHARARVEVRPGVEHAAIGVEEHAALALRGGDDATDARARRQTADHRLRAARERAPECVRVEVEAADHRDQVGSVKMW